MPTRDPEGCLVDPDHWNEQVAEAIARELGISSSDDHWEAFRFTRRHYEDRRTVADARLVMRHLEARSRTFLTPFASGHLRGGATCTVADREWAMGDRS